LHLNLRRARELQYVIFKDAHEQVGGLRGGSLAAMEMTLRELALRMRCSRCGKKAVELVAVARPRPRASRRIRADGIVQAALANAVKSFRYNPSEGNCEHSEIVVALGSRNSM
jgi:hypothetical protein